MRLLLARLSSARLVNVDAKRHVSKAAYRVATGRTVQRVYERQVRAEFLQGTFAGKDEPLSFHSAELSPASVRIPQRKIDRLAMDFADLAALDVPVPQRDKSSVALLLACRPWVFSMFSAYRASPHE